jgi:hypothetical protein
MKRGDAEDSLEHCDTQLRAPASPAVPAVLRAQGLPATPTPMLTCACCTSSAKALSSAVKNSWASSCRAAPQWLARFRMASLTTFGLMAALLLPRSPGVLWVCVCVCVTHRPGASKPRQVQERVSCSEGWVSVLAPVCLLQDNSHNRVGQAQHVCAAIACCSSTHNSLCHHTHTAAASPQ